MWIARFRLKDEADIYSPLCQKHHIEFFGYPLTSFKKNNKMNLLVAGTLSGKDGDKEKFLLDLKKDGRVKRVEESNDFILIHAAHPLKREILSEITTFYNPECITVKPVRVSSDGWEYWELACLDKKELSKAIRAAQKHYHGKLFSIRKESLRTISMRGVLPDMTEKQKGAIELAFKEGYYEYPKKLTIPELAKIGNCAYSTFQEHLKKAEKKAIEDFFKFI
ncbi:Bacterioopsin transcriptional activator [uncultured archaeon]|nr:Bacterioopsin transcriptional activator [uncultured archaeon]